MKKLEKERRFLVKLPLNDAARQTLSHATPVDIKQTYLIPDEDGGTERVRSSSIKLWKNTFRHFTHTKKVFVSSGVNEEDERDVTEGTYDLFIRAADLTRVPIEKTRYILPWDKHEFELDIFHGANEGLSILEIELEDMTKHFTMPPYLEIEKEITGDDTYSNYNLAKKK